jgi:uncharacterized repeat protein (TIGR01451 family)
VFVRRRSLNTAVLLLAVLLPRSGSRAAEPGADLSVGSGRVVIARSPAPPPAPLPPAVTAAPAPLPAAPPPSAAAPDAGLRLVPPSPAAPPASPSGVEQAQYRPPSPKPLPPPVTTAQPAPTPPPAAPPVHPVLQEEPKPGAGQAVALYVEKIGPAEVTLGEPLAYEIVVRNPGKAPAEQVRVQDELPPGTQLLKAEPPAEMRDHRLTWELGTLRPSAECHLKVEVQPVCEGDFLGRATATCAAMHALKTRITRPRLALAATAPESVRLGDAVTFRLRVTNNGTGPAEHVVVHAHLPAGLQHAHGSDVEAELGSLAPGASKVVPLAVTALQGGRQTTEASAWADGGLRAKASATVRVVQATLLLRLNGPRQAALHRPLECRLEVVNTGDIAAAGVRLTDTLPAGLDFVSAGEGGAYTAATRTVEWALGTLAPGQSRAVTLRALARKGGDWIHETLAHSENGPDAKAGTPVHVEGVGAVMLSVVDLDDPLEVGAETTYELRVTNQGTGSNTGVRVVAVVPDGMDVVSAEGPAARRIDGKQVSFEPLPRLAGKAGALFRVRVKARREGDWRFKAYLRCDQLQGPVYAEESTQVYDGGDTPAAAPGKGRK